MFAYTSIEIWQIIDQTSSPLNVFLYIQNSAPHIPLMLFSKELEKAINFQIHTLKHIWVKKEGDAVMPPLKADSQHR